MIMIGTVATRRLCQCILLLTSLFALFTCPHSKVEESFNLQASHDLFYHGLGPAWRTFASFGFEPASSCTAVNDEGQSGSCSTGDNDLPYDHLKFPGVVPRTFAGPFILSSIAKTISWVVPKPIFDLPSNPMVVQFLVRFELLLFSWMSHVRLSKSLERYFGGPIHLSSPKQSTMPPIISNYYLLITASQFHIPFYSSRLLPNTFALLLVNHAYAEWFNDKPRRTAIYLVFATAIFRCDVLLLLFTVGLTMLLRRELSIVRAIVTGVLTGVFSLVLTVPLDSLLWRRPIWPEFEVWWFNTVDNRSSEWGTHAWHWYFSKALPKGMLLTALLVPLAFVRLPEYVNRWARMHIGKDQIPNQSKGHGTFDIHLLRFFAPACGFVMLYSFLPHKEIRFIFPALPMFNACAAYGMTRLHQVAFPKFNDQEAKRETSSPKNGTLNWVDRGMYLCGIGAIVCTMIGNLVFTRLSKENYPGGVALERLSLHLEKSNGIPGKVPENKRQKALRWENVRVHIDVAAAMTGVSLFGQRHASHCYSNGEQEARGDCFTIHKSGYEEENSIESKSAVYTHLLTEQPSVEGYHVIETIPGYPWLDMRSFQIVTQDAIFILERNR